MRARPVFFLFACAAAGSACTSILGSFDFDGPATGGSGGSSSSSSSASSSSSSSSSSGSTCSPCSADADCHLALPGPCAVNKCDTAAGCCTTVPAANGSPLSDSLQTAGDCQVVVCDGTVSGTKSTDDPTDVPAAAGQCQKGTCNGSGPAKPGQKPVAGACSEMGGSVCGDLNDPAVAGKCVGCNDDLDCADANKPFCLNHACFAPTCMNGTKDGTETDKDCGGTHCPKCGFGKACLGDSDCAGGSCQGGFCAATCTDGETDNDETDIDCGGTVCTTGCAPGQGCKKLSDCATVANGTVSCTLNFCHVTCQPNHFDCDNTGPCANDITTDKNNCGGCGNVCSAYCTNGSCNDPVAVAVGAQHTCAILGGDGSVWCWGDDSYGQLGDGATTPTFTPQRVPGLNGTATAIAAGRTNTCAVLGNQSVWCWGNFTSGQGAKQVSGLPSATIAHLAAGDDHMCAVTSAGALYCWGANYYGQIGNGSGNYAPTAVLIMSSVTSVATGYGHTCALKSDATVSCWGGGMAGQLGDGMLHDTSSPGPSIPGLTGVLEIASASACGHTCARTSAGVFCWGNNNFGQIGNGMKGTMVLSPPTTPLNIPGVTQLATASQGSGAVTPSGRYMWGSGGVIGDGTFNEQLTPKLVTQANVAALGGGEFHACSLTSTHQLACWGSNNEGQLGNSNTTMGASSPVPVMWP